MVWLNVGRRERRLLFLLLERDEPRERVITVWGAVYREFKIDYEPYKSKKGQREMFCEERYVRRAFWRVFEQGWARPVWAVPDGFSFTPASLGDRGNFVFCVLTAKGRLVAEQLKRQEQLLEIDVDEVVGRAVGQLRSLEYVYVTVELVLDFLWGNCFQMFVDRMEFDRYWNGKKLGRALRRCGVRRSRIDRVDGRRKYCLVSVPL